MRRREFIGVVGGAAVLPSLFSPFVARAQQAMPVIGFLDSGSPAGMDQPLAAFGRGLAEAGFTAGQNVAVEYRWANGRYDQLPALAGELVSRSVNVIAATRGPGPARAAKAASSTIPIVFQSGSDPVKDGLVASLNRPGSNVTGASRLSTDLIPKRLGLIMELVPNTKGIALLVNAAGPQFHAQVEEMQEPARTLGLKLDVLRASSERELDDVFTAYAQSGASALVIANDQLFIARREQIVALALRHAVPTSFAERESAVAGGLMSYAASFSDSFRQVGALVGRILKGARPEDLPVQQPVKFELVINLRTAKKLGLTVPLALQASADEIIE
jgi:putative ABC transport system substrate-binding protein